jgi:predicted pyridoxine 5'-phosphate oxidase superfamily flavin-nucleotide-binding protein
MAEKFLELTMTDSVRASQQHYYGALRRPAFPSANDTLSEQEIAFIRSRDSFYLATLSENDWPYIQHRGGQPGFLHVFSPAQLAFADFKGNRQLLSMGNLASNDRVCLFLMDYCRRARLKILGRAKVLDARVQPELVVRLAEPEWRPIVERIFLIDVVAFDWNCPQHIVPRFTADEVAEIVAPLKQRIAELEQQLKGKS